MKDPNQVAFQTKLIWPAGVVLLTLLVAALIFKSYLLHPNQHIFAFGGDPWVIYYDMIYHAQFDHSTILGAMNYPYGEYVFLTDAQGAFSTVLQWINQHLFYIGDNIPGIMHGLMIYLIPVCSLMVFYILVYFDVRKWLALVFAVLITFLSPAMLRFGPHFGLAYPFVIPMTMLWFLRKYKKGKFEIRDVMVLLVLIFFTLNNPYIGFGASGFLLCSGFLLLLWSIKHHEYFKNGILITGVGVLAVLLPFLLLHLNDPVADRLQQQWGFFYFNATLRGLFFPPLSILHHIFSTLNIPMMEMEFESHLNLGFVSTLLFFVMICLAIRGFLRKKKWDGWILFAPENIILLGGATMMFMYAANHSLLEVSKTWLENHLGPLLMFKASGRLGWSIYFAVAISGVVCLDNILKKIKSQAIVMILFSVLVMIWAYEIKSYVASRYNDSFHDNFLKAASKNEMLTLLKDNQIDISQYQAMLVLPKMMAWNDDFLSDINWAAQFFSMRISAATGLPMISAMLSRTSVSQSAEAIQMIAHPIIKKDLIDKLPNQKDILLLEGGGHAPLNIGEQYLIDIARPLFLSKDFSLYSLNLDTLRHSHWTQDAQDLYQQNPAIPKDIIHLSFDNTMADYHFYGSGAKYVYRGETMLLDRSIPVEKDTQYVFSAWSRIETTKPGVGEWHVVIQDSLGQVISDLYTQTRRSNDIQGLWIRSELTFHAPKGCRIQATVLTGKDIYIDEVQVYPINSSVIIDFPGSKEFLFDNYKVEKPKG